MLVTGLPARSERRIRGKWNEEVGGVQGDMEKVTGKEGLGRG